MGNLSGASAVVTGAGSGLGRALCLEIARRSGRVVVSDVSEARAEETLDLVKSAGAQAELFVCDVAQVEQVDALSEFAERTFGATDLLCNNAGVAVSGPFEELSLEDWRWIVDINLWGVIYGCRAFLPRMRERRRGFVVNVASAAGLLSAPIMSPYNVTKTGVVSLSETLHAEYKEHGVNITALCPTFFQTRIFEDGRGPEIPEAKIAEKWMARSKVQAPDVARIALDDVCRGAIYSVPMLDGKAMWLLKRVSPSLFYRVLEQVTRLRLMR